MWDDDFHPSNMHYHVAIRQEVDLVYLPAILTATARLRVPRVGSNFACSPNDE
jgi:hypothetical protein